MESSIILSEKEYWKNFYKEHRIGEIPSSFAEFVMKKFLKRDMSLLEMGCGNGRDAFYFASNGVRVTAYDLAEDEINYLTKVSKGNPEFRTGNFTELSLNETFDFVYSRFTFHSIDEESEDAAILSLPDLIKSNGIFLLEARSLKDEPLKKVFGTDHYRRYLDYGKTIQKIKNQGFEIIESAESQGLAIYKEEDPFVLRIIAQKN